MSKSYLLTVADGRAAQATHIENFAQIPDAIAALGLMSPHPTLVLVGGAGKMSPQDFSTLERLFVEAIAPAIADIGAVVIDGGTDCGIMALIGKARQRIGATFPLVGVAAIGTVRLPASPPPPNPDAATLEPHHSHFILVPGNNWGDESPWLAAIASSIAGSAPSLTIVSNGGEITWQDVTQSVKAARSTVILGGSGRTADTLAAALRGEPCDDRAHPLVASGLLRTVDMKREAQHLGQLLRSHLSVNL